MRGFCILLILCLSGLGCKAQSQNFNAEYEKFKLAVSDRYTSFREECNKRYADFLRHSWTRFNAEKALEESERNTKPPIIYNDSLQNENNLQEVIGDNNQGKNIIPKIVDPVRPLPQPKPIEPVREEPLSDDKYFSFKFYGLEPKVRMSEAARLSIPNPIPEVLARHWEALSGSSMNNTIRDCLENRIRYKLNDWAYLQFLWQLASSFVKDENGATFLTAFLFCQSGYQTRLAKDEDTLFLLFGCEHLIYKVPYFVKDGNSFYPFRHRPQSIQFCDARFEGEKPLSLIISEEPYLGESLTESKEIKSKRYENVRGSSRVPEALIDFYNEYPTGNITKNFISRWAMYANTPISTKTKDYLYPDLQNSIAGLSEVEAANRLLNLVQTGFEYEYDDKIWGEDRAFFGEETLYYPYSDCEDRSILFSHLIRDLLNLDVALIYYPGHLATAVKFNSDISGATILIDNQKFIICDPTYIGAPIGKQMPGMNSSEAEAILLNRGN